MSEHNFQSSSGCSSLRNKYGRSGSTSLLHSIAHIRKHWLAQVCLSSFLRIRPTDHIGPCCVLTQLSRRPPGLSIYRNRWLALRETWVAIRANLLLSHSRYFEYSRSLSSSETLEYHLSLGIYAEVLCCCSIGGGCGGVLPSGSSVQRSTRAASEHLHRCYKREGQMTGKSWGRMDAQSVYRASLASL